MVLGILGLTAISLAVGRSSCVALIDHSTSWVAAATGTFKIAPQKSPILVALTDNNGTNINPKGARCYLGATGQFNPFIETALLLMLEFHPKEGSC